MSAHRRIHVLRTVIVTLALWVPVEAAGQSSAGSATIEGTVRDASGAALAGVTVEVASPALIEGQRRTTTNAGGRYAITGLRPGTYTVTFSREGFTSHRREGVEANATGVFEVSADMQTGPVAETVTVRSSSQPVEARSTPRQIVLTQEQLDRLPFSRSPTTLAAVLPGTTCSIRDVGGLAVTFGQTCTAHGGSGGDQRITMDGMNLGVVQSPDISNFSPNSEAIQEVVIETAASGAAWSTSGVKINFIPRDGGNRFQTSLFATAAFGRMQSRNLSQELIDQGTSVPDVLDSTVEINPVIGGPIVADRLWFSGSFRAHTVRILTNQYFNHNAFHVGGPESWVYVADTTRQARSRDARSTDIYGRLTWQVNSRNRVAIMFSNQDKCECPGGVSATRTPEAAFNDRNPLQRTIQPEWRSPLSDRLMLEFVGQVRDIEQGATPLTPDSSGVSGELFQNYGQLIGVTINNGTGILPNNFTYHGPGPAPPDPTAGGPFTLARRPASAYHASMTYLNGVHTFKLGVQDTFGKVTVARYSTSFDQQGRQVRYTFATPYEPLSVTAYTPSFTRNDLDHDLGVYVQDQWSLNRLTLNLGARLDWFKTSYPAQEIDATLYGRPAATFDAGTSLDWKDVTPRFGLAYDLTGKGRTALKFAINKYVQSQGLNGIGISGNPLSNGRGITNNVTRGWRDDGNYLVDCDIYNTAINGECTSAVSNSIFNTVPTVLMDEATRYGWGRRPNNWELMFGVQHELWAGMLLDAAYYSRRFGNHIVSDDTACVRIGGTGCRDAVNYRYYDLAVPVDSRLPGGGGYMLEGFVEPDCSGASATCTSAASLAALTPENQLVRPKEAGAPQIEHWNGVDVSVRMHRNGLFLLGGVSTGRRYLNECEVWARFPEVQGNNRPFSFCEVNEPFRTAIKGLAGYTLPRFSSLPAWLASTFDDVSLAAIVQSTPGGEMTANYNMPNAEFVRPCPSAETTGDTSCSTLGRPLANMTRSTDTRNVVLVAPGTLFDERHSQIDLRLGKVLSFGRTALAVNMDVFNLLNGNAVLARNNTLGQSRNPGSYAATREPQADGGYNSLWVPTSVLMPRVAKVSLTFDF